MEQGLWEGSAKKGLQVIQINIYSKTLVDPHEVFFFSLGLRDPYQSKEAVVKVLFENGQHQEAPVLSM